MITRLCKLNILWLVLLKGESRKYVTPKVISRTVEECDRSLRDASFRVVAFIYIQKTCLQVYAQPLGVIECLCSTRGSII